MKTAVRLTDAERVDVLLDENKRLRDELAEAVTGHRKATWILSSHDEQTRARVAELKGQLTAVQEVNEVLGRAADATERLLERERKALELACANIGAERARAEQAEAECAALREARAKGRPPHVCTLGELVGVAIGAGLVGVAAGASVVAEIVGRLPW